MPIFQVEAKDLSKNQILDEAYRMLAHLSALIDNHHYASYSVQGLKDELEKISSIQDALERMKDNG